MDVGDLRCHLFFPRVGNILSEAARVASEAAKRDLKIQTRALSVTYGKITDLKPKVRPPSNINVSVPSVTDTEIVPSCPILPSNYFGLTIKGLETLQHS